MENNAMLQWNEVENCWECTNCGARFSNNEVARLFSDKIQIPENFFGGYCMDCGAFLDNCLF